MRLQNNMNAFKNIKLIVMNVWAQESLKSWRREKIVIILIFKD
jgi:hypothetical protein